MEVDYAFVVHEKCNEKKKEEKRENCCVEDGEYKGNAEVRHVVGGLSARVA